MSPVMQVALREMTDHVLFSPTEDFFPDVGVTYLAGRQSMWLCPWGALETRRIHDERVKEGREVRGLRMHAWNYNHLVSQCVHPLTKEGIADEVSSAGALGGPDRFLEDCEESGGRRVGGSRAINLNSSSFIWTRMYVYLGELFISCKSSLCFLFLYIPGLCPNPPHKSQILSFNRAMQVQHSPTAA